MRLEKFTIGSAKQSVTHQFKNLKNITINFDQEPDRWVTVVIGWNGTGKSNVLEALAIIFRDLLEGKRIPSFAFQLEYKIGSINQEKRVRISADPDLEKNKYKFEVIDLFGDLNQQSLALQAENSVGLRKSKIIPIGKFIGENSPYLPRFVFSYYSGLSSRMQEIFQPYINRFDDSLVKGDDKGFKRMFYALPIYSHFVLLAFCFQQDKIVAEFLKKQLGVHPETGIESILFELHTPYWFNPRNDGLGDQRLWNAKGVVQEFVSELYQLSLAPVKVKRTVNKSHRRTESKELLYLFIKDMDTFNKLVGNKTPKLLFRDLESTYVSDLIEAVHIKLKLDKNNETVTFRELSEGEQQLLTVLGLLRFTSGADSLFLLDEPDTHLNPRWAVEYLKYLQDFVSLETSDATRSCHIVMTTHNPLAIAELDKEQIQILGRNDKNLIYVEKPDFDPRGMGFAGIITSDMFGLGSSLDKDTQEKLLKLHSLSIKSPKDLTVGEKQELIDLRNELEMLDFNFASTDRLEQEFRRANFDLTQGDPYLNNPILSSENKEKALTSLVKVLLNTEID